VKSTLRALLALLFVACSGGTPPPPVATPVAEPTPAPEPVEPEVVVTPIEEDPAPEGPACDRSADCEGETQCRGPAGCDEDWACGEPRECGEDQVGFCGCDGFTFYAPENCPGRRYVHTGPCDALGPVDEEPVPEVEGNSVCRSNRDCRPGFTCTGTEGCSTLWTCVRRNRIRPRCRREEERFCSCDGDTFEASATCPARPFLHRGYCPGDEPPPEPLVAQADPESDDPIAEPPREPAPVAEPEPPPGPRVCIRNRDCPRGQICQGTEGCTSDWHCARPVERCIADTQYFCSCGGETFTSSMTCPGRPHRHRGSCSPEESR